MAQLNIVTQEEFTRLESELQSLKDEVTKLRQKKEPSDFVTRKEAAGILKVTPMTIINYEKRGILTGHRVGRNIRYKRKDVNNALEAIQGRSRA